MMAINKNMRPRSQTPGRQATSQTNRIPGVARSILAFAFAATATTARAADDGPAIKEPAPSLSTQPFVEWNAGAKRVLRKEVIVQATPQQVWRAWTTSEGMAEFFPTDSNIDLRIGGPYELFMRMDKPDESGLRGSESCRVLTFLPREMLAFEWNFPPAVMNLRKSGAKTHVVIRLHEHGENHVRVTLTQLGWGVGPDWDAGYEYFDRAWGMVLESLKTHFAKTDRAAAAPSPAPARRWTERHVTITAHEEGERRQDFEMKIAAPVEDVWRVIATGEGLQRIGGRDSRVELIPGGKWEFWPGSPTRVQAYVPNEMLAVTGSAPPKFPEVQKGGHWGVYFLTPESAGVTRLRLSVVGWKEGEEWEQAFNYFLKNNPIFLEWIYEELAYPVQVNETPDMQEMIVTVNAPRADVWRAFTTKEGVESWMVAKAEIDFRIGGLMRTHYDPKGEIGDPNTIENEYICYEPERMLSIRVHKAPSGFQFKDIVKTMWTVIYFDDVGESQTRVRLVGLGHQTTDQAKAMREHFRRGNAWTLRRLLERFADSASEKAVDARAKARDKNR